MLDTSNKHISFTPSRASTTPRRTQRFDLISASFLAADYESSRTVEISKLIMCERAPWGSMTTPVKIKI
jgi:hypothetical protein